MTIIPVKDIRNNVKTPQNYFFITNIKALSTEKSSGVDIMHPKLVKLVANYLARRLSQSIKNSKKKDCFPKMQWLLQLLP